MPATTVLPPPAAAMAPPASMVMTPTVVVMRMRSPSIILLMMTQMQEEGQDSSPHEEEHLHDAHGKRSLQHRAGLLHVLCEWVARLFAREAKRAQRPVDCVRPAVPVLAVCGADEAQFVDGCDKRTEETQVDEGDEDCMAFGRAQSDQSVETPEDGDHGDDEQDEDRDGGDLVRFEESIHEVGLSC